MAVPAVIKEMNDFLDWVREKRPPFVFIYGDESYLIHQVTRKVLDILANETPEIVNRVDGNDGNLENVLTELRTTSLFTSTQVAWLNGPPWVMSNRGSAEKEAIELAIQRNLAEGSHLVICSSDKVDTKAAFFKLLKKQKAVLQLNELSNKGIGSPGSDESYPFLQNHLKKYEKTITPQAFALLREQTENSLWALTTNLDLLVSYVGAREKIELDDVRQCVPRSRQEMTYTLTGDIGEGKLDDALDKLHQFFQRGESPISVHALLSGQIRSLAAAKLLKKHYLPQLAATNNFNHFKNHLSDMKEALQSAPAGLVEPVMGKHPFVTFLLFKQSDGFALRTLTEGLVELARIDKTLKTTSLDGKSLMENLIIWFCRQRSSGRRVS